MEPLIGRNAFLLLGDRRKFIGAWLIEHEFGTQCLVEALDENGNALLTGSVRRHQVAC